MVSGFPERVLNLCASRRLALWDVCWITPTEFACALSWQDYRHLRRAAEKLDCTLTVEGRRGMPFFLRWLRGRRALSVSIAVCAVGLLLGSFFIWDFEIEGNVTVTDREILRALEANGIVGEAASVDVSNLQSITLWYGQQFFVKLGDTSQMSYKIASMVSAIRNPKLDNGYGELDVSFTIWKEQVGYTPFD